MEEKKFISKGMKASVAFFISSVVTSGISYIVTPIYTRILSTEEYGQTHIFMTWLQILGIVAMFCLSYGVFNNGMVEYPDKRDEYSYSMLILSNVITLLFSFILFLFYPLFNNLINLDIPLLILMCIIFLVRPAFLFWTAKERYELKYKGVVFWTILTSILSPTIAIICIHIFKDNRLYARLFGAECFFILVYTGFYIYVSAKAKFKLNIKYWKDALLFNLPLIPHYLSTYLLSSSDKIMISNIIDDTSTAFYSVAYSVASVAMIVWTAANSSLIPFTYEKCKAKDYKAISKIVNPILTIFGAGCILIILLAPEVVTLMASNSYKESIYAIPPIVGGVFFQVHYYLYANILYYYKKPKFVMIGSVVSTVLNLFLNYFFLPIFGFIAASYTTLICYIIQAIIDYFSMKHIVKDSIYNMKYIGLLSLMLTVIAVFSNFIYNFAIIRYTFVLAILGICIIFRKKILSVLIEIRK